MLWIDWAIVGAYVVIALVLGFIFVKKASHTTTDFFVAGRSLPWWIAGTSLVATTFSTDTPLFVAGLARNEGIHGNWFWWSAAIGQTATIFFFAKLWRRTKVLTDVELIQCRYDPSPQRDLLRVFKVYFDGVFVNCVVMASVTIAATKVVQAVMGLDSDPIFSFIISPDAAPLFTITETGAVLLVLGFCAMVYSMASGLYGVVYTDLVQFGLAMVGTIWLAVVSFNKVTENGGFAEQIKASAAYNPDKNILGFFPDFGSMDLVAFTFVTYVFVVSWQTAPGTGYLVQRMLATRSEKDSLLAFLWYNFCHYVLRPWPWIVVGLASMVLLPELAEPGADAESAFPLMIDLMLGPGIKGVIVAAMLAAYMSTLDTHLNWGASYLVNDLYQPFIRPKAKPREQILVSRVTMFLLTIMALEVSTRLTGIIEAYKLLGVFVGGVGTVLILRWYWWRVSAWSEVAAIVGALILGSVCEIWLANPLDEFKKPLLDAAGRPIDYFAYRVVITTFGTAVFWVLVTVLSTRVPSASAIKFCREVRPSGPGWRFVREREGIEAERGEFVRSTIGWLASIGLIYSMLLGIGSAIFSSWTGVAICAVIAVVSGLVLKWVLKRSIFGDTLGPGSSGGSGSSGDAGSPGGSSGGGSGGEPLSASAAEGS
jgi:solute:Na+ symporter, SSS family